MTHNEVKQTLKTLLSVMNFMDPEHLKKLFIVLVGVNQQDEQTLRIPDVRKTVKSLVIDYSKQKHLDKQFDPKQIKQIYKIMGDYNYFPICGLCGQPIYINTQNSKNFSNLRPMEFTWDHIHPKSLGGEDTLSNFQPSHKFCNNHKGNKCSLNTNYTVNVVINIGSVNIVNIKSKKVKHVGLRKQDAWCHKERRCGR